MIATSSWTSSARTLGTGSAIAITIAPGSIRRTATADTEPGQKRRPARQRLSDRTATVGVCEQRERRPVASRCSAPAGRASRRLHGYAGVRRLLLPERNDGLGALNGSGRRDQELTPELDIGASALRSTQRRRQLVRGGAGGLVAPAPRHGGSASRCLSTSPTTGSRAWLGAQHRLRAQTDVRRARRQAAASSRSARSQFPS